MCIRDRVIAYSEREREFTFAKNCQRQSCSAINCLSSGIKSIYWQGEDLFPLKTWLQVTYPLLKACLLLPRDAAMLARSGESYFCPSVRPSVTRFTALWLVQKEPTAIFLYHILITANMQSKTGFQSSHQLKSYVVAPKSRLKLAARCPVSSYWPSCFFLLEMLTL